MDSNLRRVYLSVAIVLFLLWAGMLAWVLKDMKPGIISFISAPTPLNKNNSREFSPLFQVPGISFSTYHTLSCETFSSLSKKFNLLETTLRSLNQDNDNSQPEVGTTLIIPSQDGIFHVLKSGQGMADIARAYGISLKEILKANHKKGDVDLQPGEVLYLPGATYLSRQDVKWLSLASLEIKKGFLKPTTGRFADGFGPRLHPITGKEAFHEGLDLAPGWRARVVASQDGRVQFAALRAGFGRLIILDHGNGLTSWYAHLDDILVKPQQLVKRGDLIGKVGKTGRVTGPHLHFEIRLNGIPQNPLLYLVQ
jgi:murein DD-endopeptidase MepM/ murein hydrolase activator NlpD